MSNCCDSYGNANVAAFLPLYGGNIAANVITGTLATGIQPNITVVGPLTGVTTTGNIVGAGNIVVTSNITTTNGSLLVPGGDILVNGRLVANGIVFSSSNIVTDSTVVAPNANISNAVVANSVYTDHLLYANGTPWSGGSGNYGNANVAAFLPGYYGDAGFEDVNILGNLSVAGNVIFVDVDVITTNDLTIQLGNNVTTNVGVNGGGIVLGNVAGVPLTSITYDGINEAWDIQSGARVLGDFSVTGNTVVQSLSALGNVDTANVNAGAVLTNNYLYANGQPLNLSSNYSNANVAGFLPVYTGNVQANGISTLGTGGNITGANVISANTFIGNIQANNVATGNIIPKANGVYSLGNATNQWKDLYVSSNTIYIGSVALQTSGNTLLVNGNTVVATDPASGAPTQGNIAVTGSVTAQTLIGNISGINVIGEVGSANTAQIVVGAVQTAITQVGTLATIQISGRADLGDVSNVKISGGSNGYLLTTNGNSDLNWSDLNRGQY